MNKLTLQDLEALVKDVTYLTHGTLTVAVVELTNGATVTGEANCIDPVNHDAEIGKTIAKKNAIDKLWGLEGYACKTRGFPVR